MRKRFALLWTPLVLGLALLLPSTTAAATLGKITFVDGYCSGSNTVNAKFKVTKYSGFYASKLTLTVKGQGYYNGSWHTELNIGTWTKWVYTSGSASYAKWFWFKPGHSGKHRILAVGKIWNGGTVLASGKSVSGYCS